MTDADRQWIVEPPSPGEIALHLAVGEGVQLTEEQERAVGELLRVLEADDPEVTGHAFAKAPQCPSLICQLSGCSTLRSCDVLGPGCTAFKPSGSGWNLMGTFGNPT